MDTKTPTEDATNAVKTESSTEQEIDQSENPKTELKTESGDASEPPAKRSKIDASGSGKTIDNSVSNEPPVHEMVGGSSVRQYLNKHLTVHLLEGLKQVSANKSDDPLLELGEFLISRSKELKDSKEK